jgi:hypothetical protein
VFPVSGCVSGFGCWVSSFGERNPFLGFRLWVWYFVFRVRGLGFRISSFGFWIPGFGFLDFGLEVSIRESMVCFLAFWFRIPNLGFWVQGLEYGV